MSNQNENPPKTALKVTASNVQPQDEFGDINAMMQEDLNAGVNKIAFDEIRKIPAVDAAMRQAITFLPLLVQKGKDFFGEDKKRIWLWYDVKTGSIICEIMDTDNIKDFAYHVEPTSENFYILKKEDMANPEGFLRNLQAKFKLNLF